MTNEAVLAVLERAQYALESSGQKETPVVSGYYTSKGGELVTNQALQYVIEYGSIQAAIEHLRGKGHG